MSSEKSIRKSELPITPLILNRWSPRALSGEKMGDEELLSLFEAAKWAPSAFNSQPWRFIYVKNGTPSWDKIFSTLANGNKIWTAKAAALVLVISRNNFEYNDRPNPTASFDCGAAWQSLALEASARGLVAHAMSGFDFDAARANFKIPEDYQPEVVVALGHLGKKDDLPEDFQKIEFPSDRKKVQEIISEGEFKW
ncbi:MAG: nitroreductase family protein [Patescibacteria group bacterium]|jgi:nitroreductase